jgi:pyruvate/2-oxoglutarate dehydrogenase complex dihydrolipoamide acyltransferase (E2) component
MDGFGNFLLNEERGHLGHQINDVLTGMQDLQNDMENMGTRHLNRLADQVVNQIRKILHGEWAARNHQHLEDLQKIAVAIKKTIEEKGDLKEVLPAAVQAAQKLAGELGVKVNDLDAPEMPGMEIGQEDLQPTGPDPAAPQQPEQPPMDQGVQQPQPPPPMDQQQQGPQQPPM